MKILVTGANGQLGKSLFDLHTATPWEWVFTSRNQLDLSTPESIKKTIARENPDVIVNTAAYTAVDKAEKEETLAFKINRDSLAILADAISGTPKKIIHISTDYVFDGRGKIPYRENGKTSPKTIYGHSKSEGEAILIDKVPKQSFIIRTSWLFSEYGSNFVKTMLRLGNEKSEISVVNDQLGKPTYAGDLATGIIRIIEKNETDEASAGIYHFSNENSTTWYEFAKEIMKLSGLECKVIPIESYEFPTPAKRPAYSVLNTRKFAQNFNFTIRDWKLALKDCLNKIQ